MTSTAELIVTGPNDGIAIVELDLSSSTVEDILVLSEAQLDIPCATLVAEVESPPDSGAYRRLNLTATLAAQGVKAGSAIRLVAGGAVSQPTQQRPTAAPSHQSPASAPPTPQPHTASAAQPQQHMSPDDLIRHLMSGGGAGAPISVSAPTQQQYQQHGGHPQQQAPQLDPMDPDYQRKLYEQIQQENVQHNLALAMEHTPEAFARVIMLYVPAVVNKHHITAFVDSGAQMTIMNEKTAEKCGIMHLLDRRFGGVAKGVGSAKILGRVHMAMVSLGGIVVPMSISVLEDQSMDFLIGLDQLRRHQMCIDLKKGVLRIGDDAEVPFLHEGELPDHLTNRTKEEEEAEALSRANSQA